ncbi:MAG: hypothetical protein U5S82_09145 [Gammaproteobacteria bacterium]|nr:hypothetical protein [Gammaproteobacteria bacterium]
MAAVRPLRDVPRPLWWLLALTLAAQLLWHGARPGPGAAARDLPPPPSVAAVRVAALGEEAVAARLLMLWLQAFDNQPGVSIPFRQLDYERVQDWLALVLELDPRARYPLLAAARLYAEVPDEGRQRAMLEFIHRAFLEDPNGRWRWLAHATILAKHRLGDLPLALRYAQALTDHATGPQVPFWARDMSIAVLEDMGELEAARALVGGLLASGTIEDPRELHFLERKLEALESPE